MGLPTPLSAAFGLSFRRLATASNEVLASLRAHLRTRRRNDCYTRRRRRAGESFYRSRGKSLEPPLPSPLLSASSAVGSLPRATNAAMLAASLADCWAIVLNSRIGVRMRWQLELSPSDGHSSLLIQPAHYISAPISPIAPPCPLSLFEVTSSRGKGPRKATSEGTLSSTRESS
jgi:hypothetical protein